MDNLHPTLIKEIKTRYLLYTQTTAPKQRDNQLFGLGNILADNNLTVKDLFEVLELSLKNEADRVFYNQIRVYSKKCHDLKQKAEEEKTKAKEVWYPKGKCGKRVFPSVQVAKDFVNNLKEKHPNTTIPTSIYYCNICKGEHLTKMRDVPTSLGKISKFEAEKDPEVEHWENRLNHKFKSNKR